MHARLTDFIKKRIQLPAEDIERSFEHTHVRHYKKGDYVLHRGEYCRFIGFLNSGLIMGTISDEAGREIACKFLYEGCFFTYTEGISYNQPSHKNYVVLEDCEMVVMEKDKLPLVFGINPKFETLFSQILAEDLRNVLLREQDNRIKSVETRYLEFLDLVPNALNRIPLKYVAGYLGIEPPSLSRLRRRLAGQ